MSGGGWIGVDLDGTLAEYHGWVGPTTIGAPVPKMAERVKRWIEQEREVRIFTARVWPLTGVILDDVPLPLYADPHIRSSEAAEAANAIRVWCLLHIGRTLPITCVKDMAMIALWDDRAVRVVQNTGEVSTQEEYRA